MNTGTVTGGIVKAACSAYTPSTAQCPSVRRVQFSIAVSDSHRGRHVWNCEIEGDPVKLDLIEAEAQPGRGVKVDFELAARPFMKAGVQTGEVRFLRATHVEFSAPRMPEAAQEASE